MNEKRIKTGTMILPSIIKLCDEHLVLSNCASRNDFIEEAIKFYVGYLNKENDAKYISETLESMFNATIQISEDRMAKLLFKLAVEMSMMMNVIAANNDIDDDTLRKLRGKCIKDVKSSIGNITFEKAVEYQNEIDEQY